MSDADPEVGVFSTPGISVCINQFYLPFVTGALEVLAVPDYWEDPEAVVPQIELLIAALNEVAGDCEAPSTGWCGEFKFESEAHADIWEGQSSPSPCGAPVSNTDIYFGYALVGCTPSGTNNTIFDLHAHFDNSITAERIEVLYSILSPGAHATGSAVVLWQASARGSGLVFVDTGLGLAADIAHAHDFSPTTGQDWVVELQVQSDGAGPGLGDIVLHEVRFFGTGDAPIGSAVCA